MVVPTAGGSQQKFFLEASKPARNVPQKCRALEIEGFGGLARRSLEKVYCGFFVTQALSTYLPT